MEPIKKHIQEKLQRKESEVSLTSSLIKINNSYYLKTTSGELTKKGIENAVIKLASNFKSLDDSFFKIMADRVKKNGFDDISLDEAVNNLIDNFHYHEPKVADIVSLNPNIRLYKYQEVASMLDKTNKKAFEIYRPIIVPGVEQKMYAHKYDIQKYNLKEVKIREFK